MKKRKCSKKIWKFWKVTKKDIGLKETFCKLKFVTYLSTFCEISKKLKKKMEQKKIEKKRKKNSFFLSKSHGHTKKIATILIFPRNLIAKIVNLSLLIYNCAPNFIFQAMAISGPVVNSRYIGSFFHNYKEI